MAMEKITLIMYLRKLLKNNFEVFGAAAHGGRL